MKPLDVCCRCHEKWARLFSLHKKFWRDLIVKKSLHDTLLWFVQNGFLKYDHCSARRDIARHEVWGHNFMSNGPFEIFSTRNITMALKRSFLGSTVDLWPSLVPLSLILPHPDLTRFAETCKSSVYAGRGSFIKVLRQRRPNKVWNTIIWILMNTWGRWADISLHSM